MMLDIQRSIYIIIKFKPKLNKIQICIQVSLIRILYIDLTGMKRMVLTTTNLCLNLNGFYKINETPVCICILLF